MYVWEWELSLTEQRIDPSPTLLRMNDVTKDSPSASPKLGGKAFRLELARNYLPSSFRMDSVLGNWMEWNWAYYVFTTEEVNRYTGKCYTIQYVVHLQFIFINGQPNTVINYLCWLVGWLNGLGWYVLISCFANYKACCPLNDARRRLSLYSERHCGSYTALHYRLGKMAIRAALIDLARSRTTTVELVYRYMCTYSWGRCIIHKNGWYLLTMHFYNIDHLYIVQSEMWTK